MPNIQETPIKLDNISAARDMVKYADSTVEFVEPATEFIDRLVPLLPALIQAETSFVSSEMSARAGFPVGEASLNVKTSYAVYKFSAGADIVQTYKNGQLESTRVREVSRKTLAALSEEVPPASEQKLQVLDNTTVVTLHYTIGTQVLVRIDTKDASTKVSIGTFEAQAAAKSIDTSCKFEVFGYTDSGEHQMSLPNFALSSKHLDSGFQKGLEVWNEYFLDAHKKYMQNPAATYAPKLTAISVSTSHVNGTDREKFEDEAALIAYCWRRFTFGDTLNTALAISKKEKTSEIKKYKHVLTDEAITKFYEKTFSTFMRSGEKFNNDMKPPKDLIDLSENMFKWFNKGQA